MNQSNQLTKSSKITKPKSAKNRYKQELSIFPTIKLVNEQERKTAIKNSDKKETINLLQDFLIEPPSDFEIICSKMKSYSELENWRRNYIKQALYNKERNI